MEKTFPLPVFIPASQRQPQRGRPGERSGHVENTSQRRHGRACPGHPDNCALRV